MASRGIRGRRIRMLNKIGFGEVSRLYCEEAGSIRKLCELLFTPRKEGEQAGVSCFYAWLNKNNLQLAWKETVRVREQLLKDATVKLPEDFEWDFWQMTATIEGLMRKDQVEERKRAES